VLQAKYYELCGHYDEAIELLNQLIVVYGELVPPLVEKLKVLLCLQDWDQADEVANRWEGKKVAQISCPPFPPRICVLTVVEV
jgi:tetratricopeptide (TPR) repeat protein